MLRRKGSVNFRNGTAVSSTTQQYFPLHPSIYQFSILFRRVFHQHLAQFRTPQTMSSNQPHPIQQHSGSTGRGGSSRGGRGHRRFRRGQLIDGVPGSSSTAEKTCDRASGPPASATVPPQSAVDVSHSGSSAVGHVGTGIEALQRKVDCLSEENNVLKQKVSSLELELLDAATTRRAYCLTVSRLEEDCKRLSMENEVLRKTNDEFMSIQGYRQRKVSRSIERISDSVESIYLGLAIEVDKKISDWCRNEVAEIVPFDVSIRRNWQLTAETVTSKGIVTAGGAMRVPFPPMVLARQGTMFTASHHSEKFPLQDIIADEMKKDAWSSLKSTEEERDKTVSALSENSYLRMQIRRQLSDYVSYKKRILRDTFFDVFQYGKLSTKSNLKTDEEKQERIIQVEQARRKLLVQLGSGDYLMGWWRRCTDATKLTYRKSDGPTPTENMESDNFGPHPVVSDVIESSDGVVQPI